MSLKRIFSPSVMKTIIVLLIMAAVIKTAMLTFTYLFLPSKGENAVIYHSDTLYSKYKPSAAFNIRPKKAAPPPAKKVPVYKLDKIKLKAIYATKHNPFIVIEDAKKIIFISKNELFKGYKLIKIEAQKATFEKNRRHYILLFKQNKNKNITYTPVVEDRVQEDPNAAKFIKRNDIKHYAKNFDAIWKEIKIKELIKRKKLQGFLVTWVRPKSIFSKMGLKKNDIIIGANGKTFKSLSQVFKTYNNINKMDSLILKIKRDNEEKELEYEIY